MAPNLSGQQSNNLLNQANLQVSSQQYGSQNDDAGNSYLAYGTGGRAPTKQFGTQGSAGLRKQA